MISDDEIENEGAGHMTEGEVGKSRISMSPLTDQGVMWSQVVDPVSERKDKQSEMKRLAELKKINQPWVVQVRRRSGTDQDPMCAVHVAR